MILKDHQAFSRDARAHFGIIYRSNPGVSREIAIQFIERCMALPQLTEQQLTGIVQEVIANARQRQESYLPRGAPLSPDQKAAVRGFFPERLLSEIKILELKNEHVPNPLYQKRAQMRGYKMMLDFRHMADIAHPRLIIFQEKLSLRVLFHGLVHVVQYAVLGLERYLELYVRAFVQTGNYPSVPLEVQAFQLDHRFTENPGRFFSVEAEVRKWAEAGDYILKAQSAATEPRALRNPIK